VDGGPLLAARPGPCGVAGLEDRLAPPKATLARSPSWRSQHLPTLPITREPHCWSGPSIYVVWGAPVVWDRRCRSHNKFLFVIYEAEGCGAEERGGSPAELRGTGKGALRRRACGVIAREGGVCRVRAVGLRGVSPKRAQRLQRAPGSRQPGPAAQHRGAGGRWGG